MRASATSRLAPPAGFHAGRADSNTPKADEASPFALLVGAAVAPAQKPSNTAGNAGGKNDETPDDDNQANAAPANQTQAAQTQITQTQPAAPAGNSPQPPANDSDDDAADQDAMDQAAAPVSDRQQTDLNMAPPVAPVGVSDSGDDAATDENNVSLWPQSARPSPQTGQAGKLPKIDKTDKSDKKNAADQTVQPEAATVAATDLIPLELQAAAVPPAPAPQVTTAAITDDTDQTEIAAAPAIAPATQPVPPAAADQIAPQESTTSQTANQTANQTASQDAPQTGSQTAPQTADQPAPPPPAPGASPQLPLAAKVISAKPDVAAADAKTDHDGTDQPQVASLLKDAPVAPGRSQPKPVTAKADTTGKTAKPASDKPQLASDPAAVKGDAAPAADDGDDSVKPDTAKNAVPSPDAAAPKPVANAAATIAVPPAGQTAPFQPQAADFARHIQVTAQSHETPPNLPALAVDIVAKSLGGAKQFDIRLDPPELGRVEVRLSIDATGKASAHLSADQPQTLSLLQKDASVLTRALRDAGLDVSQNGLNFSLRQQSGQDTGAGANLGRRSTRGLSLTATTSIEATAASAAYSGPADGHLDIRV